jgi:UDP-glucose 4-epimerase
MILITGSAGYIGSEICKKLDELEIDYVGIDNLKYSNKNNIYDKKKFIKTCISNKSTINKILRKKKIQTVIHCAAYAYVLDAESKKKYYIENNVIKTKKFINYTIENQIDNFIFLSSSNIYSENDKLSIFKETDIKKPKNLYGKTKLYIENFLINKKNKYKNITILRLFNIIGLTKEFTPLNKNNFKYQRFLFKIFYQIKNNKPINLKFFKNKNSDKKKFPERDFLDIRDLVDLIGLISKKTNIKKSLNIYNVGRGKSQSLKEIIKYIKLYSKKKKLIINYSKLHEKEYFFTKSSIKKIKKKFSWSPKISIKKSILSYYKYLLIK